MRQRNTLVWSHRSTPFSMKLSNSFMVSARGICNTKKFLCKNLKNLWLWNNLKFEKLYQRNFYHKFYNLEYCIILTNHVKILLCCFKLHVVQTLWNRSFDDFTLHVVQTLQILRLLISRCMWLEPVKSFSCDKFFSKQF